MTKFRNVLSLYPAGLLAYYLLVSFLYQSKTFIESNPALVSDLLLLSSELTLLAAVCYISRYRLAPSVWRCLPR